MKSALMQRLRFAATLSLALVALPSAAGFILEQPAAAPTAREEPKDPRRKVNLDAIVTSRIGQKGTAPSELPPIRGMGKQVTLLDALKQLLPAGWKAFEEGGVDLQARLNWAGTKNWVLILHDIVTEQNLTALVDWDKRELTLSPAAAVATQTSLTPPATARQGGMAPAASPSGTTKPGAALAATGGDTGTGSVSARAPANAPATPSANAPTTAADNTRLPSVRPSTVAAVTGAPALPATPIVAVAAAVPGGEMPGATKEAGTRTWRVTPDKTLRENLRRWANEAGWALVWSAQQGDRVIDYQVDAPVVMSGEFAGRDGVVARLITAYGRADHPLEVEFYRGNQVVEVRLRNSAISK